MGDWVSLGIVSDVISNPSHNITSAHKVPAIDDFNYFPVYFTTLYSLQTFSAYLSAKNFYVKFYGLTQLSDPTSTFSPRVVRRLKQFSMEGKSFFFRAQCFPCPFVCCYKQTIGKLRSDSQHSMYGWIAKKREATWCPEGSCFVHDQRFDWAICS